VSKNLLQKKKQLFGPLKVCAQSQGLRKETLHRASKSTWMADLLSFEVLG
jgi:hypothetical protein